MSHVIELRFKEDYSPGHHLFIRNHQTRIEQKTRPKGKTILCSNIPPWCPNNKIKNIFKKFGKIENVEVKTNIYLILLINIIYLINKYLFNYIQIQLRPGKFEENKLPEEELVDRFRVAYIVYSNCDSLEKIKLFSQNEKPLIVLQNQEILTGINSFCEEYNNSFPDVNKLQVI